MQRPWLLPFVPFYAIGAGLFHALYDLGLRNPQKIAVPVISVGNITLGGTGKTPFACWLLAHLKQLGIKPAYLSRGYGRKTRGVHKVNPAADQVEDCGDEALMVARALHGIPVWVGEDRVAAAQMLVAKEDVDILVLDDAFQHRKIFRDLDIVLLDATRMPDQDVLFPAGNLREPVRALKRAHLLVINRVPDPFDTHMLDALPIDIAHAACRNVSGKAMPVFPGAEELINAPVALLAGLGNNRQYFSQLKSQGYNVTMELPYPDHHLYTDKDISLIIGSLQQKSVSNLVTTTKDLMRLKRHLPALRKGGIQVWETPVTFSWVFGMEEMEKALRQIFPNLPVKSFP